MGKSRTVYDGVCINVILQYDRDCERPICESGDEAERFVSFNSRHASFTHPNEFRDEDGWLPELTRQFESEEAFLLSYHEHGNCVWGLQGQVQACPWDTVGTAGIYWLPSDVPADERKAYAESAMEQYTEWCNGSCYGYMIEVNGELVDSCYGYVGDEHFMECVSEALQDVLDKYGVDDDVSVEVLGEAKWLADYHSLPEPANVMEPA